MLKEATIARLAALAKLDPAALTAAIKAADEQDVTIPDNLQTLAAPDLEVRDRNEYNRGKKAGTEMSMKELKTKHNLQVDGEDPDKIVEAIAKKAVEDAKIAPDKQVEEARKDRDQWKQKATAAEQAAADLKKQTEQLAADNRFRSLFPKDRSEILTDDEYLDAAKRRYAIETREGREVMIDRTTGDIVKDKTKLEPVAPPDVLKGYFTERKWIAEEQKPAGGRGGGDSKPGGAGGKFSKLSEVRAHVEGQGKNPLGMEGQAMIQAAIKENPGIDMNS